MLLCLCQTCLLLGRQLSLSLCLLPLRADQSAPLLCNRPLQPPEVLLRPYHHQNPPILIMLCRVASPPHSPMVRLSQSQARGLAIKCSSAPESLMCMAEHARGKVHRRTTKVKRQLRVKMLPQSLVRRRAARIRKRQTTRSDPARLLLRLSLRGPKVNPQRPLLQLQSTTTQAEQLKSMHRKNGRLLRLRGSSRPDSLPSVLRVTSARVKTKARELPQICSHLRPCLPSRLL